MNLIKRTVMTILTLSLFLVAGMAADKQPQDSLKRIMHRIQAGDANSNGWYVAESTGGKFKVELPAKFNDFAVAGIDENGTNQDNHIVGTALPDNTKYSATLSIQSTTLARQRFDGFASGFNKAGVRKELKKFMYHGHEAIEIIMNDTKRSAVMRMIIGSKGLFLLIVEFDTDKQTQLNVQIKHFMDSLGFPSDEPLKL